MKKRFTQTVIVAAGLDPSGGAGLWVDCAAIRATGCRPAGVPTVLTVQNGLSFSSAEVVSPGYLRDGMHAVMSTADVGAVKIGALKSAENVRAIAEILQKRPDIPVVLDPVILSTSGGRLLDEEAVDALRATLFPLLALVTPNLSEASDLTGLLVRDPQEMTAAAKKIARFGPKAVLVKGGHLGGAEATDVLLDTDGSIRVLETVQKAPYDVRGTGCALSSLIAGWIARGLEAAEAVQRSRRQLQGAIETASTSGAGPRTLGDFREC